MSKPSEMGSVPVGRIKLPESRCSRFAYLAIGLIPNGCDTRSFNCILK